MSLAEYRFYDYFKNFIYAYNQQLVLRHFPFVSFVPNSRDIVHTMGEISILPLSCYQTEKINYNNSYFY